MKQRKRMQTFTEILYYMEAPHFNDLYQAYYDTESDGLVILAENPDHIILLHHYADVDGSPIPGKIKASFNHVPGNCMIYLKGQAIESFADSLLEILMRHVFKPHLCCA